MALLIGRYAGRASLGSLYSQFRTLSGSQSFIPIRTLTERSNSGVDLVSVDGKWKQTQQNLQARWRQDTGIEGPNKEKKYILAMFPYPSGDLHMGHMRVYTISDVLSRFWRMQGYEVIHPIGWDAFGLPAENAANERGIDPASWTEKNIEKMKGQLQAMNCNWDWDREIRTCDPSFYKHTQRLFLLLHNCGLAYQAESMVNYDPIDKTVLANEQVDANGMSWRSGAKVEKRMLKQWFFKISEFREDLLEGLESLEGSWPERVLAMQKNWLGKSTGARIQFPVIAYDERAHSNIEVFTTRPDTLFGVQYLALASTHPIVQELAKSDVELQAFLDTMPALPPDSKVGYLLPHVRAINPLAYEESTPDATKASLPIYVTPYVLGDYGDGAVMGVPGHDIRDHAFWKHNRYDEPIRMVISQSADESTVAMKNEPFIHQGHLTSHSGSYAGKTTADAAKEIVELLESKGLGSAAETWRLRDWLISRQRYWGTPIPIIHCDSCGPVPVPDDQLPVELPPWTKCETGNPLEHAHDWVNTSCPKCHGSAKRDTDTMDTFVDSSWYFMRFIDPQNEDQLFDPEIAGQTLPVDLYIGGVEHAILHLLYARFISKFLAATSLWKSSNSGEPFRQLLAQGMVHGKTYTDPSNGRFLKLNEVDVSVSSQPVVVATGQPAAVSFEKMSKSKYNGVDPIGCMDKHSTDATRAHILFQAPVSEVLEWDEEKISGVTRWFQRIHDHIEQLNAGLDLFSLGGHSEPSKFARDEFSPKLYLLAQGERYAEDRTGYLDPTAFEIDKKLWRAVQSTIISVTESYSNTYSLNTVVSDLMALTKMVTEVGKIHIQAKREDETGLIVRTKDEILLHRCATMALVQMLAPIAPAFADHCWSLLNQPISTSPKSWLWDTILGSKDSNTVGSVHNQLFPELDGTLEMLAPKTQPCAVQVNGKLKVVAQIPIPDEQLKAKELEDWAVQEISASEEWKTSQVAGKLDISKAKKVIVVRGGKTVNFVL